MMNFLMIYPIYTIWEISREITRLATEAAPLSTTWNDINGLACHVHNSREKIPIYPVPNMESTSCCLLG